jgi:dihydrofolate reductase
MRNAKNWREMMRKIIAITQVTLDGVMQSPGGPEEDPSNGFTHGGWAMPFVDDALGQAIDETIADKFDMLLGRRTYDIFAAYWPNAPEEEQVVAKPLNEKPKYVASTTLTEPLPWQNSTLLQGDLADSVAALKQENGGDLHIIGSTDLVQALIPSGLVDEFRFMIDPIVLGGGKRIFPDDGALRPLVLVESEVTSTGSILATYVPEGE